MSWFESSLTRLETRLRAMIEGDAARDGVPRQLHNQVMSALVEALHTDAAKGLAGAGRDRTAYTSPDQYTLVLPTEQAQLLLTHPAALDRLARKLERAASQANLPLAAPPMLRVVADPGVLELKVFCTHTQTGKGDSLTVELEGGAEGHGGSMVGLMPNAFLIVNGLSTFRLTLAVTNIGSDPSNQLILANPRISPLHAQIRLATGRLTIFDLDSREGTYVNGVAVSNHLLNPGDVIILAGLPLVYGEETSTQVGLTQELPAEPPPPEVM